MKQSQLVDQNTTDPKRRLRILISSYAMGPNQGSEPGKGWNVVKEVSKYHDVWVITRSENRPKIEKVTDIAPLENIHWIYFDTPYWLTFWYRGAKTRIFHYYLWQLWMYNKVKTLNETYTFDLLHHISYSLYHVPCPISRLPVPFIWGPVGGGETTPSNFYSTFSLGERIKEYIRVTIRKFNELNPLVRLTARSAELSFATTTETATRLHHIGANNVQIRLAIGIPETDLHKAVERVPSDNTVRFLSIGRLLGWKGFHLSLQSFAKLCEGNPNYEYWIIGKGPERGKLEALCHQLGITEKVRFLGSVPREQVLKHLNEVDILLHPSMHESGGWVVLEAMTMNLPVVCLSLGGPNQIVTDKTGFRIKADNPDQVISDMKDAMITLATDSQLRHSMGSEGRKRVKDEFLWNKRGEYYANLYYQVIAETIK